MADHYRHACPRLTNSFLTSNTVCTRCVCYACHRYSSRCPIKGHRFSAPEAWLAWDERHNYRRAGSVRSRVTTEGFEQVSTPVPFNDIDINATVVPTSVLAKYIAGGDVTGSIARKLVMECVPALTEEEINNIVTFTYAATFDANQLNVLIREGMCSVWAPLAVTVPFDLPFTLFVCDACTDIQYPVETRNMRTPALDPCETDMLHSLLRTETYGAGYRVWTTRLGGLFVTDNHEFCSTVSHDMYSVGSIKSEQGFDIVKVLYALVHHRGHEGGTLIVVPETHIKGMRQRLTDFPTLTEHATDARGVQFTSRLPPLHATKRWWRIIVTYPINAPVVGADNVWFLGPLTPRNFAACFGGQSLSPNDVVNEDHLWFLEHSQQDLPSYTRATVDVAETTHLLNDAAFSISYTAVTTAVKGVASWWNMNNVLMRLYETSFFRETYNYAADLPSTALPIVMHDMFYDPDDCPVCFEPLFRYKKPLVLTCGHVVCASCMKGVVNHQTTYDGFVPCPLCRTPLTVAEATCTPMEATPIVQNEKRVVPTPLQGSSVRIDKIIALVQESVREKKRVAVRGPRSFLKHLHDNGILRVKTTREHPCFGKFSNLDFDVYLGTECDLHLFDVVIATAPMYARGTRYDGKKPFNVLRSGVVGKQVEVHICHFEEVDP